jgi:hypothetical protein
MRGHVMREVLANIEEQSFSIVHSACEHLNTYSMRSKKEKERERERKGEKKRERKTFFKRYDKSASTIWRMTAISSECNDRNHSFTPSFKQMSVFSSLSLSAHYSLVVFYLFPIWRSEHAECVCSHSLHSFSLSLPLLS